MAVEYVGICTYSRIGSYGAVFIFSAPAIFTTCLRFTTTEFTRHSLSSLRGEYQHAPDLGAWKLGSMHQLVSRGAIADDFL